ncbi:MAG: hypothetical protein WCJ35_03395 [Planctomycetota bacterium]
MKTQLRDGAFYELEIDGNTNLFLALRVGEPCGDPLCQCGGWRLLDQFANADETDPRGTRLTVGLDGQLGVLPPVGHAGIVRGIGRTVDDLQLWKTPE